MPRLIRNFASLNGQVLYLDMDKIIGSTLYDRSGNGNNGTINGPIEIAGKIGKALSFDGINDTVAVPHHASIAPQSITVMAWWYTTKVVAATDILMQKAINNYCLYYQPHLDYQCLFFIRTVAGAPTDEAFFAVRPGAGVDAWYHLAGTYNKDTAVMKIYINGVEKTPTASGGTPSGALLQDALDLALGSTYDGVTGQFHEGYIDEVRIYNRALTAAEIRRIYVLGQVKFWHKRQMAL